MTRVREGLSLSWTGRQWIARYKALDGTWSAKRLPARFTAVMEGSAAAWAREWYEKHLAGGGWKPTNDEVSRAPRVSLADIFDRWVAYREGDPGTDVGYARSLRNQYENWIGKSPIAKLDIATELGPLRIVQWMRTLTGAASTKLTIVSTLSVMLNDAILHGAEWGIDPALTHPMLSSPAVKKHLDSLRSARTAERVTPVLEPAEIEKLFTERTSKVIDARRVKYCLWLHTGMRDREVQGLVWGDVKDLPMPHVWVSRQLVKAGPAPALTMAEVRQKHGARVDLATIPNAIVKPPKRNSRRALPLRPLAAAVLAWWRATGWQQYVGRAPTDQDPIFPSGLRNSHRPHGEFCTPTSGAMFLVDLERLGIPTTYRSPSNGLTAKHTSRTMRHTFASLLSQVGVDDGRIGDLLGHSAATVTRTNYIETLLGARAEAVSRLPLPDRLVLRVHEIRDPSKPAPAPPAKVLRLDQGDQRRRK